MKLLKRAARQIPEQSTEVSFVNSTAYLFLYLDKTLMAFDTLKTSWIFVNYLFFVRDRIPTRLFILDLKDSSTKTEQAQSKIFYSDVSLFNSLPSELKDIKIIQLVPLKENQDLLSSFELRSISC